MTPRTPRLTLAVTKEFIENAKVADAKYCMIAQAVLNRIPHARWILVDVQSIRFTDRARGVRYIYFTPKIAQQAIVRYDQGILPKPFSFMLTRARIAVIERTRRPSRASSPSLRRAAAKARKTAKGIVLKRAGGKQQVANKPIHPTEPFSRRRRFGLRALESAEKP